METTIQIHGKPCRIELSKAAEKALVKQQHSLIAEMVITLACVVRKHVKFREESPTADAVFVKDNLYVRLMSGEHCGIESETNDSIASDIAPIVNWKAIAPHWVKVDHKRGEWVGEFGYGKA